MRILLINSAYEPEGYGGTVTFTKALAVGLHKMGHTVAVATIGKTNKKRVMEKRDGIDVYWEPSKMMPGNGRFNKLKYIYAHRTYEAMKWVVEDFRPDVIHLNNEGEFTRTVWETGIRYNIPLLATMHDSNWYNVRRMNMLPFYKKWGEYLINKKGVFKKIVTPSKYMEEDAITHGKLNPGLLETIWNGVDMDEIQMKNIVASKLGRDDAHINFLYAGRLEDYKGIKILLDAWQLLGTDGRMQLHICGNGALEADVIRYEKHNPGVEYHGRLDQAELGRVYDMCDVVIIPSLYESFGLVFLEGIIHGCAIICSGRGGLNELMGYFEMDSPYDACSPEELEKQIMRYSNRTKIKEQIKKNMQRIGRFSVERQAREYEKLYNELLC